MAAGSIDAPGRCRASLSAPADADALPHLAELDSVRGIAVLLVLLFHAMSILLITSPAIVPISLPAAFIRSGHSGVDLFFVLSGFLLGLPLLARASRGEPPDIARFFKRRVLRIVPAFWVAVILGTVLSASRLADLRRAVPYLFFLHGLPVLSTPLFPYSVTWWSLATEAEFYLLLPLLGLALCSSVGRVAALAVAVAWTMFYLAVVNLWIRCETPSSQILLENSLLCRAPVFLAGIVAAELFRRHGTRLQTRLAATPVLRRGGGDVLLALVLLALARHLDAIDRLGAARSFPMVQPFHIESGILWAGLILAVLLLPLRLRGCIDNRVLAHLGDTSYSIYLVHAPVIWFGARVLLAYLPAPPWTFAGSWAAALTLSAVAIALAEIMWRLVELPFMRRKARLTWVSNPG